jgi:hypothetical protein
MLDYQKLESVVEELLDIFEVDAPPVPIEVMLQKPLPGMWEEVDITQLSSSYLKIDDVYSPRMSVVRLLARHIVQSGWGAERGLNQIQGDAESLRVLARMLVMPKRMIANLSPGARTPTTMRLHFEVPEPDANDRLQDLARYS